MTDKRRVKGVAVHRPIVYGSVSTMIPVEERVVNPDHNMRWTVAVRSATSPSPGSGILEQRAIPGDIIGGGDDLSHFVKKVSFKLHDSYPNPLRTIDKPPYEINETGWGEFLVYIKIYFVSESGEKPLQFQHGLKLHDWLPDPVNIPEHQPWLQSTIPDASDSSNSNNNSSNPSDKLTQDNSNRPEVQSVSNLSTSTPAADSTPDQPFPTQTIKTESDSSQVQDLSSSSSSKLINSWQYDEIVFTEPSETFYQKLLSNPITPLPEMNRFPDDLVKQIGPKGESGEFNLEIEEKEFKKLNWAKLKVLIEIDKLRGRLVRAEKELTETKRSIQQLS